MAIGKSPASMDLVVLSTHRADGRAISGYRGQGTLSSACSTKLRYLLRAKGLPAYTYLQLWNISLS